MDSVVEEVKGTGVVQSIVLLNKKTNELTELKIDGVFVYIGYPIPVYLKTWLKRMNLVISLETKK